MKTESRVNDESIKNDIIVMPEKIPEICERKCDFIE